MKWLGWGAAVLAAGGACSGGGQDSGGKTDTVSGEGGASATGGARVSPGAAGDANGAGASAEAGAGGSGGASESPVQLCLETRTEITPDEMTPIGFSAAEPLAVAAGERSAIVLYADGFASHLTLNVTIDGARFYFVEAEPNPDRHDHVGSSCDDRVEIETDMSLISKSLRLDEHWSPGVLKATSPEEVTFGGTYAIASSSGPKLEGLAELGGRYAPSPSPDICVPITQLDITVTADRMRGALLDTWLLAPCDTVLPTTGATSRSGAVFDTACPSVPEVCCCQTLGDYGAFGATHECNDGEWTCRSTSTVACQQSCE